MSHEQLTKSVKVFDAAIIGAGAVGVAVARELTLKGLDCVVVEKNECVLSEASSGNTGHLATNFYYTKQRGPLEFEMTRRASQINKDWLREQPNVPGKKSGLLYVAKSESQMNSLKDAYFPLCCLRSMNSIQIGR